jgi:hypothetical protein
MLGLCQEVLMTPNIGDTIRHHVSREVRCLDRLYLLSAPRSTNSMRALLHASSRGLTLVKRLDRAAFTGGVWYYLGTEMNALAHGGCSP